MVYYTYCNPSSPSSDWTIEYKKLFNSIKWINLLVPKRQSFLNQQQYLYVAGNINKLTNTISFTGEFRKMLPIKVNEKPLFLVSILQIFGPISGPISGQNGGPLEGSWGGPLGPLWGSLGGPLGDLWVRL